MFLEGRNKRVDTTQACDWSVATILMHHLSRHSTLSIFRGASPAKKVSPYFSAPVHQPSAVNESPSKSEKPHTTEENKNDKSSSSQWSPVSSQTEGDISIPDEVYTSGTAPFCVVRFMWIS